MRTERLLFLITGLLVLLFVYAATAKLIDLERSRIELYRQPFPNKLADVLIWAIPTVEILAAVLLLLERSRRYGLYVAAVLLVVFTAYIVLILVGGFGQVPCSCGGVIKALGWKMHLLFNIFFLLLTFTGLYLMNRERRSRDKM